MDTQTNFSDPPPPAIPPHKSPDHWFVVAVTIVIVVLYFIASYFFAIWPFNSLFPQLPPLSPTATLGPPPAGGQPCGGIVGLQCPEGSFCQLHSEYPDADGICVKTGSPSPETTPEL